MEDRTKIIIAGLFLIIGITFISFNVLASNSDYVYEQGKSLDLKRPCFSNGTFCSGSAVCNITILNPDSSILVNNEAMTNQISFHNYSLSSSQMQNLGIFNVIMSCTDGSLSGSETFNFQITPMGSNSALGFFIIIFLLLYGITLVGAYFDNFPIGTLGGFGLMALGIFTMTEGIDIYRNFATDVISYITIAIGVYFGLTGAVKIIQENM